MKTNLLIIALIVAMMPLSACNSTKTEVSNDSYLQASTFPTSDEPTFTKKLNLAKFHGIDNELGVRIFYTQSNTQEVKFEGSESVFDRITFKVENGILKMDKKTRENPHNTNFRFTLRISAPYISQIENNGSMEFHADRWKADDINIESNGSMSMLANITQCGKLKMENNGAFRFDNGQVTAESVQIENNGSSRISVPFNVKGYIKVENNGASRMNGRIKAKGYKEESSGSANSDIDVEADQLDLEVDGAGTYKANFKGNQAKIEGAGSIKLNINVDCTNLNITSDGVSKIAVSGTADKVSVENDGVTKVDTSMLNKL